MFRDFPNDLDYKVVINHEEQYSLWPTRQQIPSGWTVVGPSGSKRECTTYIEEVWTDMRPLSLHTRMAKEIRRPD